jgi:hypothetical protein
MSKKEKGEEEKLLCFVSQDSKVEAFGIINGGD